MEAARLRVQVRAVTAKKKDKMKTKGEGASSSSPKAVRKGASKRKVDRKDNCPPKKASVTARDRSLKKLTPSKPSHGEGKDLMTSSSLIAREPNPYLLTNKDYVVGVVESIIRDKDVDPCAEQGTEELEASGLFDLVQVLFCPHFFFIHLFLLSNGWRLF